MQNNIFFLAHQSTTKPITSQFNDKSEDFSLKCLCFHYDLQPGHYYVKYLLMSTEIEIKLAITKADIPNLLKHPIIQQYSHQDNILAIKNTYFDTKNLDLSKQSCTLRIRQRDNQFLQTLKRGKPTSSEYKEREEFENQIDTPKFEINKFPDEIQSWLSTYITQLEPMFTTDFERQTWQLILYDNTHIELALDQGVIKTDSCSMPISEVELELKSGNINTLKLIAKQLQTDLNLQPGTQSKANRGFLLRQQCRERNVK